ncbi:MAG: DNA polymerase III subunit delta' [Alphaproteobacteria bacterium]|nr:MAG: DNA polymerase III subunit delta' [Alphaproteobacteria bacterium]
MNSETTTAPEPRSNPLLLGHDAALRDVAQCLRSGRVPHGWLICGPRGVGKATLAYRFARHVLAGAAGADDLALDPGHPVFRRTASGGHPDLLTVERGYDEKTEKRRKEILVADVRQIGSFVHMTAAEGGWRVIVVDSVDEMNRSAANALLKVLEEPPSRTLLLMVSHAPGRLLPTIRSRCRKLALSPLPDALVTELLDRYRPDLPRADAAALARLAEGSIGRALELAELGGLDLYRRLGGLLLTLPRLDGQALHQMADKLSGKNADTAFRTAAELLSWWLGRMIQSGATGRPPAELLPGEADCMARLLRAASLDRWLELWEKTTRLFARTESANLDRRQVWVSAFLDIEVLSRS